MSEFAVAAKGISRVYGRHRALARLDLTLGAGSSTALLGPNGAGKSTLCGILSTLLRPSTGEVTFRGARGAAVRGLIGVCAHESLCYADLSGRENLAFFGELYGLPDPAARAAELLARVGLDHAADRPSRTYSRGMLQRLALARALVHAPRMLILDEPFTGLDRAGIDLLAALLREERARGTILVVVTHDLDAVAGVVERVLVLERGHLVYDGPAPTEGEAMRALYQQHTARATR